MRAADMMRASIIAVVFSASLALLLPARTAAEAGAGQPADPLLGEVRAAWEKRQQATKTVRVAWTQKNFRPKGAITARTPRITGEGGKPVPYEDTTHTKTASLLLDGMKFRLKYDEMVWDAPAIQFAKTQEDSSFIDGVNTTLMTTAAMPRPMATINKERTPIGDISTWPLRTAFRGTDHAAMNGVELGVYTFARRVTLDGRALVELTRERDEFRGEKKLWVDPAQDYAVQRDETYDRDGKLQSRITVTHRRHESGVWVPHTWSVLSYEGNKLIRSATASVTELTINLPTSPDDFQVTFPPGTRVIDTTGKETKEYIIRENQAPREVLPGERLASTEDLLRTEAGDLLPGGRPSFFARNWKWIVAIVVGGLLCGTLVWLVRRRRVAPEPTPGTPGDP